MSVQTEIDRITQNVASTYAVLEALGADMPEEQTSENLAATAGSAKAVLYSEQTLTEDQKTQARQNIGAAAEGEGGGTSVQPDWNQTDETAADFIKNKPFGDTVTEIMAETEVTGEFDGESYCIELDTFAFSGDEAALVVAFDGVEYTCVVNYDIGLPAYGNAGLLGGGETGEPFLIVPAEGVCLVADAETHTLSIASCIANKLDEKYIDAASVFYADGDGIMNATTRYLYTDVTLTNQATLQDVRSVLDRKKAIMIDIVIYAMVIGVFSPVSVLAINEYAVMHGFLGGENIVTFYTAEYVPETT